MTLAIVWKCTDGAILGADTEFTVPGYTKYKGNKVLAYPELQSQPFFAFAGEVAYSLMCIDRLAKLIKKVEEQGAGDVPAEISNEIKKIHSEYFHLYNDERLTLQLLIVMRHPGAKLAVYKVDGPVLAPVADNGVDCIGQGVPVARLAIAQLYQDNMTTSQADSAVMYTLFQAKSFAPEVGGDSEVVFFRDNYPQFGYLPVSSDSVRIYQETLAVFHVAARPILLNYDNLDEETIVFKARLKRFSETLIRARSKQIKEWKRRHKESDVAKGVFEVVPEEGGVT